jgi:hypothetical protein
MIGGRGRHGAADSCPSPTNDQGRRQERRTCGPGAKEPPRPYGVEAVARDNSGNWLVLVEPREFTPADFA